MSDQPWRKQLGAERALRDPRELQQLLDEDLDQLQDHCTAFDLGKLDRGRPISAILRRFFDDASRRSGRDPSLVHQLGRDWGSFADSGGPAARVPGALSLPVCTLLSPILAVDKAFYAPCGWLKRPVYRSFADWWEMPVFIDTRGAVMSRHDLVRNLANTDGGVHIDQTLPRGYRQFSRENSLGLHLVVDRDGVVAGSGVPPRPPSHPGVFVSRHSDFVPITDDTHRWIPVEGRPEMLCMRQIAYEVLLTLSPARAVLSPIEQK